MSILAVQAIRRMRGGAQAQLMLGADSNLWVVKFQNNPQHLRVLANEFLVSRLAEIIGLPVPKLGIIEVTSWLAANSPQLELGQGRRACCVPGVHFGSRFIRGLTPGDTVDYLPEEQLAEVINRDDFAGVLALDKWTGNCDGRQAVFSREPRGKQYKAAFIDHGFCFNVGDWDFPYIPTRGVYGRRSVYADVLGWDSFSPWLELIEEMPPEKIQEVAEAIPSEWYSGDRIALDRLVGELIARRKCVRGLITDLRRSYLQPFPNWID